MAARVVPDGMPHFGYCLDTGNHLVGLILLVASVRTVNGAPALFSNVASWYVKPEYRAYAQLLVSIALRNKDVTYTNVTPAPHTWSIVENQGYSQYCSGLYFAPAILKRPAKSVQIEAFDPMRHAQLPNAALLARHQAWGCSSVVVQEEGLQSGYVFRRFNVRSGKLPLPAMFALHAPDQGQLVRIAGNLARHFLSVAAPFLVMDANGPIPGLHGHFTAIRGRKYFKGPNRPPLCDLADTEYAIFGV
jgi:hypothetical protein